MPASKRAPAKTNAKPTSMKPAAAPGSAQLTLNIFDGTRRPIEQATQILVTIRDGAQNQLYRAYLPGPAIPFDLPVHNNFADNYTVVASADGHEQAGFQPIGVSSHAPQTLDLMLLAKDADFHFANAGWPDIQARKPQLASIFSAGVNGGDPSDSYAELMESYPDRLACLLNISTAMEQIMLPEGNPLGYFKQLDVKALQPDRIFGYADAKLVDQVKLAAQHGEFDTEPAIDLSLHGDATSSFKQIQFGEANVQLTFHGNNKKTIDGVDCVYVEPDIDYYRDPLAHLFLEVIPNRLTGNLSNPRVVYVLRWIAGRHAGVPNFDPLYTIE